MNTSKLLQRFFCCLPPRILPKDVTKSLMKSNNKGKFLPILEQIAKHDPLIEKHMNAYINAKYTSKGIQNQIIESLAEMV